MLAAAFCPTTKDIAHLYVGCKKLVKTCYDEPDIVSQFTEADLELFGVITEPTLLLRPLSDMTVEENKEMLAVGKNNIANSVHSAIVNSALQTRYLLSKGFDLFCLLESGQALNLNAVSVK